eukprot:GHVH01004794.1.p1 GENE.GHVH01004794.1~~GHVH01004794.1.p1  ORF type:complete len:159 (+),score=18.59 GHVH01004794.1:123-599(+)
MIVKKGKKVQNSFESIADDHLGRRTEVDNRPKELLEDIKTAYADPQTPTERSLPKIDISPLSPEKLGILRDGRPLKITHICGNERVVTTYPALETPTISPTTNLRKSPLGCPYNQMQSPVMTDRHEVSYFKKMKAAKKDKKRPVSGIDQERAKYHLGY